MARGFGCIGSSKKDKYVSVVADGTKHWSALFDALYQLVDRTKIKNGSTIILEEPSGINSYYSVFSDRPSEIYATMAYVYPGSAVVQGLVMKASGSSLMYSINGSTPTNVSSVVPASGAVVKLVY